MKAIVLFSLLCLVMACQSAWIKKSKSIYNSNCYDNRNTELSKLINLNGYYSAWRISSYYKDYPPKLIQDTVYNNYIFYDNGIIIYLFNNDYFQKTKSNRYGFYNQGMAMWGCYIIHNDTIKAKIINNPRQMYQSVMYVWFKIIDQSTITELCFQWDNPITSEDCTKFQKESKYKTDYPAIFIQLDTLPDTDKGWLKNRKWFWCSKEKFKAWKKEKKR